MKKRITKHYDKIRQAEAYQMRLCNRFEYVRLVEFPRFTNHGNYTWEVKHCKRPDTSSHSTGPGGLGLMGLRLHERLRA